ncbi:MAG: type IV toxin-antitoxin system AbiEi family antitoxin domain-containing protein [Conexibacteraceae bacterium]|nr:type IV toxin-antitoxin system AbiEi family antitoxin domain-containing protein [Conexibacteraceae bacterium]
MARATRQHGVLTIGQLAGLGLVRSAVRDRTRAGKLHRVHQGVYALVPVELLQPSGRRMAAVLACGPGAALSHQSAGALLNLLQSHRTVIDVTVPSRAGRRRAGIQIHRSATLTPDDVAPFDGIPCTTPSRTILDLAGVLPRRRLELVLDAAEAEEVIDLNQLVDQLRRNAGRKRAAGALRRTLDEHSVGSTATWNDFEELFLALVRRIELPAPEVQAWLDLDDGEAMIRPDFLWRRERVIVETDSRKWHGTRRGFENDRRRDQRALAAGFQPIRVTWLQLTTESDLVGRRVRTIVTRAAAASAALSAGT